MKRTRYLQRILASQTDAETMGKLMKRLVCCNKFAEVERLLISLPNTQEYKDNEDITRAKIALAWNKKDLQTVYRLIEDGKFASGEDLIEMWDEAHYLEAKCRTAIQRYRVRERFTPPLSICPSGVRKKRGISKATCDALQAWFTENSPFPTATERLMLAKQHGLTLGQLKNWFANARRRLRNKTTECPSNLRQRRGRRKVHCKVGDVKPSEYQSEECSPLFSRETPVQLVDVTPVTTVINQSCSSLNPNETPWKLEDDSEAVDQSSSSIFPGETPKKLEQVAPLVHQSSLPLLPLETPWKLADLMPSFDQSHLPPLSPGKSDAMSRQRGRTESTPAQQLVFKDGRIQYPGCQSYSNVNAIASPAVMWNSVFDHTRLNSVIGGAPFPPLVAAGGQDPLPWLRKVVVLPATALNLNRFPAGLCVPGPLCWITPFSGYNEARGNFSNFQLTNLETVVPPTCSVQNPTAF